MPKCTNASLLLLARYGRSSSITSDPTRTFSKYPILPSRRPPPLPCRCFNPRGSLPKAEFCPSNKDTSRPSSYLDPGGPAREAEHKPFPPLCFFPFSPRLCPIPISLADSKVDLLSLSSARSCEVLWRPLLGPARSLVRRCKVFRGPARS